jgi:hypothetical protein
LTEHQKVKCVTAGIQEPIIVGPLLQFFLTEVVDTIFSTSESVHTPSFQRFMEVCVDAFGDPLSDDIIRHST